ncbi:MAG: FadR/GntR family transcriptional regulator [Janthinobacterium lividum]
MREPDSKAFGQFLAVAAQHDAKSFFDLVEVRQALEVQSAILAARRVNRAALAAIESALDGMVSAVVAIEQGADRAVVEARFNRLDVGFHEALALSSGNRMLAMFLEATASPLEESFRMSTRGRTLRGQSHQATLAAHGRSSMLSEQAMDAPPHKPCGRT